jgi:hypothetical protein
MCSACQPPSANPETDVKESPAMTTEKANIAIARFSRMKEERINELRAALVDIVNNPRRARQIAVKALDDDTERHDAMPDKALEGLL